MRDEALRIMIFGAGPIGVSFAAAFSDVGADITQLDPDAVARLVVQRGRPWQDADD